MCPYSCFKTDAVALVVTKGGSLSLYLSLNIFFQDIILPPHFYVFIFILVTLKGEFSCYWATNRSKITDIFAQKFCSKITYFFNFQYNINHQCVYMITNAIITLLFFNNVFKFIAGPKLCHIRNVRKSYHLEKNPCVESGDTHLI